MHTPILQAAQQICALLDPRTAATPASELTLEEILQAATLKGVSAAELVRTAENLGGTQ